MPLTKEEISNLTHLCRINCSEEEEQTFLSRLSDVLAYADLLNEVNTEGVPPCSQVIATLAKAMGEDEEGPLLNRKDFLDNAPEQVGGMIKVPPVLNSST